MPKKLPKHIVRLLILLVIFLLLALTAKIYLTDPSFYKYGHYRADAIPELAAGEPIYKGAAFWLVGLMIENQLVTSKSMPSKV